ncbi:GWxTD domain-containing protein [Pontibacter sp. CAU 1760]
MPKMKNLILLLLPALFLTGCWGGAPTTRTSSPPLPPAKPEEPEITMLQRHYAQNDSLYLILQFEDVRQVLDLLETALSYEYKVLTGENGTAGALLSDSVRLPNRKITDVEGKRMVQVVLPRSLVQEPNVLHFWLWQQLIGQEKMGNKFRVPLRSQMLRKNFLMRNATTGKPFMQTFATTSDKLAIQYFDTAAGPVELQRFDADFRPAAPPMSMRPAVGPRTLSASNTYTLQAGDTLALAQEGFYRLESDAVAAGGLLVLPGAFPQITRATEMLQPLVYLTTSKEREQLNAARDKKAAIDKFWLELAGNKSKGRDLIKEFYSRVEYANTLFSSHKAGWATDRGMIYIIYGKPTRVSSVGDQVTWVYQNAERAPNLKFVFTKKGNNFTENHYELIRRPEYEESWYSTVAKWRAGKTNT